IPNPWYYELTELGYNYRASDLQCALGHSQLLKLDTFIQVRQEAVNHYQSRLAEIDVSAQSVQQETDCEAAWHVAMIMFDFEEIGINRAHLMSELRATGIGSQVLYIPVHKQPYYQAISIQDELPGADAFYRRSLCLPLSSTMTTSVVDDVVDLLVEIIN
ncbi:MAG: UDP-4-amino-4,6-dideoxy-N-acetyl-beta-L-altrosamine transaminase, partial [Alphaproteobacteria bacterium]|nr:UDP-4-amino-4,6-dideoxy-N-acetyl-beta-L-altrosamine transaminase [Alphaproteobacteria bacterium]